MKKIYCICYFLDGKKYFYGSSGNTNHPTWKKTLHGAKKYQRKYTAIYTIEEVIKNDSGGNYTEHTLFLEEYEMTKVSTVQFSMLDRIDKLNKITEKITSK